MADLTMTRLAEDEFLVVDGAGTGLRTIYADPRSGADRRIGSRCGRDARRWCCIGIWGPHAQAVVDWSPSGRSTVGRFTAARP